MENESLAVVQAAVIAKQSFPVIWRSPVGILPVSQKESVLFTALTVTLKKPAGFVSIFIA